MHLPAHGANTQHLYTALGMEAPATIIDFSVNTNPLGTPASIQACWQDWLQAVYDYPDPHYTELKQQIATKEKVEPASLLPGNGAAELITLIARFLHSKNVLIAQPAFSEYETACRVEDCNISYYQLKPPAFTLDKEVLHKKLQAADAVFFCNPNNPTGIAFDQHVMNWLIEACEEAKTLLILDEAFYDFVSPPATAIQKASNSPYLLVLRSLTKMYHIAGLRLGYLVGHPEVVEQIGKRQPHWALNGIALKAGVSCLLEQEHVKDTTNFITKERDRVFHFLQRSDYIHSASAVNFYLLKDPAAASQESLYYFLLEKGLVLRHTYNFPGLEGNWLRAAVKKEAENNQLMEALVQWKKEE
ncbi:threonine-phosphate decarboxylase CobD [Virgibacillus halodenitrificans]|uniref:threonine-phosphate decarboxylase CobD n=1 Tax=Virgibacillus halodenitrificans TaxID=1482 RepID=UPI00045CF45A|nr:threonine-phosphate decarboxylase CobD [Virgibacillus halodenitrificans]MEC2158783.1 threonine-phosphate decarboxylase CobD [Virgibacillus halodenitrificans]CDQ32473.1 Threonine-phosphate decarboxylase [Virgibacillus halodenitrificans]